MASELRTWLVLQRVKPSGKVYDEVEVERCEHHKIDPHRVLPYLKDGKRFCPGSPTLAEVEGTE